MSDKTFNPFGDTDFLAAQKTFLDAWSILSQTMSPETKQSSTENVNNAWTKAMEYWSQSLSGGMPGDFQHVYTNMIEQVHLYNMFGEQLSGFMNNYNDLDKTAKDWQQQLDAYFNDMKTFFSGHQPDASNVFKQMLGAWQQLPMDTIQRTFSSASLMPGDFLQEFKNDSLHAAAEKYLSVPGIGYTRESQEQHLNGIRLWSEYQKASNEFNTANSRVGVKALEQLKIKIFKLAEENNNISSLREIYDLWVDANEDAYAEFVNSDEYTHLYGAMVNSLMKFKQHNQKTVDESLSALNIPTQKGVDTVKQRQQELRRELFVTRIKLKNDHEQIAQLNKEISVLKEEVKKLKGGAKFKIQEKKSTKTSVKKTEKKKDVANKSDVVKSKDKTVIKAIKKNSVKKKATKKKAAVKRTTTAKSKAPRARSASRKVSADSGMMVIKF